MNSQVEEYGAIRLPDTLTQAATTPEAIPFGNRLYRHDEERVIVVCVARHYNHFAGVATSNTLTSLKDA